MSKVSGGYRFFVAVELYELIKSHSTRGQSRKRPPRAC